MWSLEPAFHPLGRQQRRFGLHATYRMASDETLKRLSSRVCPQG
jgi:hypothetical protein